MILLPDRFTQNPIECLHCAGQRQRSKKKIAFSQMNLKLNSIFKGEDMYNRQGTWEDRRRRIREM